MKASIYLLTVALFFAACNNNSNTDKAQAGEKQEAAAVTGNTYVVDTTESTVEWTGYKPGGKHHGTFRVASGTVSAENNSISGGNFTISVSSITNKDLEGADKGKLEGHLRSVDFFEVEKYPTAKFEITKVEPYTDSSNIKSKLDGATHLMRGNLTLKDQTKNVTFPAKVTVSDAELTAKADFDIDRTQWGMNYKGPNNPQNWFIKKEVNIKLNIKAKK
jgi:polyisoprenoid-binding protein YceI